VEALFSFDSGRSKRAIAENRKIAEGLKEDKGFVYEVCLSLFLLKLIINSVFRCSQIKMRIISIRSRIPAIALILTAVSIISFPYKLCYNHKLFTD
jgi:hypothetical protein